jgi:glutamate/tyrosine decarboxylase-like PLP-dependent enzyme
MNTLRSTRLEPLKLPNGVFIPPDGSRNSDIAEFVRYTVEKMLSEYTGKENMRARPSDWQERVNTINEDMPYMEIKEKGAEIREVVGDLVDKFRAQLNWLCPLTVGQQHPSANIAGVIAQVMDAMTKSNIIFEGASTIAIRLEQIVVNNWLRMVGFDPEKGYGFMTSGGTAGNLCGINLARNLSLPNAMEEGLISALHTYNVEKNTRYKSLAFACSKRAHYSFNTAAGVEGVGSKNIIRCGMDGPNDLHQLQERILTSEREGKLIFAVVAVAGDTLSGRIDDLEGVVRMVRECEKNVGHPIYIHVDCAHTGPFFLVTDIRKKLAGIEEADTICLDPHKYFAPYNTGIFLVREKEKITSNRDGGTASCLTTGKYHTGSYTLDGSRGAGGVLSTYIMDRALGMNGHREMGIYFRALALRLCETLKEKKWIADPGDLNIIQFRKEPFQDKAQNDAFNKAVAKAVDDDAAIYVSGGEMEHQGEKYSCLRAVTMNPQMTENDIEKLVTELERIASSVDMTNLSTDETACKIEPNLPSK